MKVAMVCDYPLKEIRGGASVYVDRLSKHMSRISDIEPHIITISNRQFKKDSLNIHAVKRVFPFVLYTPIDTWLLKREILKNNPDIVHVLGTHYAYSPSAVLVRNKYPIVMTVFGIIAKEIKYEKESIRGGWLLYIFARTLIAKIKGEYPLAIFAKEIKYETMRIFVRFIRRWIAKPIERYVISENPNIIVQTPSIKDLISTWTNSKIYIVPSGIEYEEIQKTHLHLNEKPDIFLAAILYKIKGIDLLIKAIPLVIKLFPDLDVRIAGSGPQEEELKALAKRLNLEKHIKFLGFIHEEEKYQYYKACKIVVIPSRWDCQPFALFDAAASGKPVIASRIGGLQDTVDDGKTGFLFESEDIKDLANKIITLLKDEKLREEMGKAAKEKIKQYEWSKIAEKTVEIYNEVISDFYERKAK